MLTVAAFVYGVIASTDKSKFPWGDTPETVEIWNAISNADHRRFEFMLAHDDNLGRKRSQDGRGGPWWGFENGNVRALALMVAQGVDVFNLDRDASGLLPSELCNKPKCDITKIQAAIAAQIPDAKKRLAEVKHLMTSVDDNDDDFEEVDAYRLNEVLGDGHQDDDIDEEL